MSKTGRERRKASGPLDAGSCVGIATTQTGISTVDAGRKLTPYRERTIARRRWPHGESRMGWDAAECGVPIDGYACARLAATTSHNNQCVGTSSARASATIRFVNYRSSSKEVPDEHGMWVGSASAADHLRRDGHGVGGGVAGPGVAARPRPGAALVARRRRPASRRAAGGDGGGGLHGVAVRGRGDRRRPGSRRTSPSRPTRRRRGAASIAPRPIGPTPGCCASCCSVASCPSRGSRRRSCWSGANGCGCTSRWSINGWCGSSGSTPSCSSTASPCPEAAIRSAADAGPAGQRRRRADRGGPPADPGRLHDDRRHRRRSVAAEGSS